MGPLVATRYQRLFTVYDNQGGSVTHLPYECRTASPDPLPANQEWTLALVNGGNHFIRLQLYRESPLPPIWQNWEFHAQDRIAH